MLEWRYPSVSTATAERKPHFPQKNRVVPHWFFWDGIKLTGTTTCTQTHTHTNKILSPRQYYFTRQEQSFMCGHKRQTIHTQHTQVS